VILRSSVHACRRFGKNDFFHLQDTATTTITTTTTTITTCTTTTVATTTTMNLGIADKRVQKVELQAFLN
jgi:hypothetical protein